MTKQLTRIESEDQHLKTLKRIEELWDSEPESDEEDELDRLADAVCQWEEKQYNTLMPVDGCYHVK